MDAALAIARVMVGAVMAMTGVMKLVVPHLREAFRAQLRLAKLPLEEPTFAMLPFAEILVGTALVLGVLTRPAALVVVLMMLGATYVHLVVHDPSVFPLQPEAPIIPIAVMALAVFVLIGGAGAWSVS
jgi:uncharacterized membrane protein YphA (DoxX/SURF4 family)